MNTTTSVFLKKRYARLEQHSQPTSSNQHLQNIQPTTEVYTFFSSAQKPFSRMDNVLRHKKGSIDWKGLKLYKVYHLTVMEWN